MVLPNIVAEKWENSDCTTKTTGKTDLQEIKFSMERMLAYLHMQKHFEQTTFRKYSYTQNYFRISAKDLKAVLAS